MSLLDYVRDRDMFDSRELIDQRDEMTSEEQTALDELAAECGGEWEYGATFIAESYFENYARQLAEDIGAIDRDAAWPAGCIDWEEAADELASDYTMLRVDGDWYYTQ